MVSKLIKQDRWTPRWRTAGRMNLICWNCRGIGNALTVQELHEIALKFAPEVLCIVETQIGRVRAENLASTLGYDCSYHRKE